MANQISVRDNSKAVREPKLLLRLAFKSLCVFLQGGEKFKSKLFDELKLAKVNNISLNTLRTSSSPLEDEGNIFCLWGYKAWVANQSNLFDNPDQAFWGKGLSKLRNRFRISMHTLNGSIFLSKFS